MLSSLSLVALLSVGIAAKPYTISEYIRNVGKDALARDSSSTQPCASVASILAAPSEGTGATHVPADVALACLQSVPVDTAGDLLQIQGIAAIAQFQSTLAYLKNPPPGYLYPAVDVMQGLATIAQLVQAGQYSDEFSVQFDIYSLINSAYDQHFTYNSDITQVFEFVRDRNYTLYSLSTDGQSLPNIYVSRDLDALVSPQDAGYTASPVTQINGQDVEGWLNNLATLTQKGQDPDCNYNALFPNIPTVSLQGGSIGAFIGSSLYQGTFTTITFQNGTKRNVDHYAATQLDFTGITDGPSFFRNLTNPGNSSATSPTTSATPTQTSQVPESSVPAQVSVPTPIYYPEPYVATDDTSVAGFFPSDEGDLAVLTVPTFQPKVAPALWQDVVREFLATAKALGKTRLVVDLRGNGGGQIFLGYDLFKQLFPSIEPWGGFNLRTSGIFDWTGQVVTQYYSNVTSDTVDHTIGCNGDYSSPFNVRQDLTSILSQFSSWADFFGPGKQYNDDNYTKLARYNLSDMYGTGCNIVVSGYGALAGIDTEQPFDGNNIVLLQDGTCASTCTIFSELMKTQAGVQQIVMGGRKQYGPMQGVGGVKGSNVFPYQGIGVVIAEALLTDATPAQAAYFNQTYGSDFIAAQHAIERLAKGDPLMGAVNARNAIRQGDASVTPLHFVYEAADCRLFYTPPMIKNQSLVWSAAYNAYWQNGSCVRGSTGHPSSLSGSKGGNQTAYINAYPPLGANNTFGENSTSSYPMDLVPFKNQSYSSTSKPAGSMPSTTSRPPSGPTAPAPSATSFKAAAGRIDVGFGAVLAALMAGLLGSAAFAL